MFILKFLDVFFVIFHSLLIIFNVFGWMFKVTRKYNLLSLLITAFSWFVLGIFYGWGYCFLTDWHWDVLRKLNEMPQQNSYIAYIIFRLFKVNINALVVDISTAIIFFISLFLSICFNIKDFKKIKH
ncbi:MAG: DUF2784 domain-containing protein [Bacteroidales bacterium]|nr:DUF2784 domain-containing protein [Bacteroidales bacterium]